MFRLLQKGIVLKFLTMIFIFTRGDLSNAQVTALNFNYAQNKSDPILPTLMRLNNQNNFHDFSAVRNQNFTNTSISFMTPVAEKNYWLPAIEITGINLSVWAFHRYLTKEGWSDIDIHSIKHNFETGFHWDYDGFLINQFTHPYHGSTYFNAARSNGLGFWESAPYPFFGSLMWEYVMETEPPSYNDIVNTPITGIIFGEISFRVSNLIIDESKVGFERFVREFSALLINPMHGFNRLIKGEMWKIGNLNVHRNYSMAISSGINNIFLSRKIANNRAYVLLRFDLNYGNQLDVVSHKYPFDFFTVHTEVSFAKGDNIVGIFASGAIWDNKINLLKNSKDVVGIYKEIDVLINTVYKLSATSVTGQIINSSNLSSKTTWQNSLGISAILMGATNSQYSTIYGKDYNIGPGASAKVGSQLILKNFGTIYINYKRYWIHTLSGADSEEFVGLLNIGTNYNLFSNTYLGFDFLLYERYGIYKNFPNSQVANSAFRLYIKQNI